MNGQGLNQSEALKLLQQFGPNELPSSKPKTLFSILLDVLREPMVSLLLGAGGIYFLLGDRQEAFSLLGFLFLIVGITVFQERKTEHALTALRDLSSPRALVIRNGKSVRIPGREVVPGDLLLISEGDRVAADGELLSVSQLMANESLLTGESLPVDKKITMEVYAGSTIVRGQGMARVTSTALHTQLGKIGKSLQQSEPEESYLQKETRRLVRTLAIIASILCVIVFVVYALTRHDLLGGLLTGLTLAMAILPNELPAVLLIFLSAGAWRLSKQKVLTRKIPAVENLGSTTVLCVDKTGTMTQNKMAIRALWSSEHTLDLSTHPTRVLPEDFHEIVEYGILASRPNPFDPMEQAFHEAGTEYLLGTEHLHEDWALMKEYPLTDSLLAVSYAWRPVKGQQGYIVGAKGSPEAIVDLCHLSGDRAEQIHERVMQFASEGLRVLGVAKAATPSQLPPIQHDLAFEFVGLIGLADPIRPDVPRAIEECQSAGIRIVMITGDHAETAKSIAKQAGLRSPDRVMTGPEFALLSDEELSLKLRDLSVFSRMLPDQKLRLVRLLRAQGEVVAMTGDGVNDAPALKTADIGVAMGKRGTDVAREAGSIVLLDDDFGSMVAAIRMGRRTFANLRQAFQYLLAVHVPITAISIVPVIFKLPLVLMPIHIAFLHLIIEPACTVVFEAEPDEDSIMLAPPRPPNEPIFRAQMLKDTILQGSWVAFVVLSVFLVALWRGQGEEARALTFTTLMFANLGLILVNRTRSPSFASMFDRSNRTFAWIFTGTLVLLLTVLYIPTLRELFRFSYLHAIDLAICVAAGLVSVIWFVLIKRVRTTSLAPDVTVP